MSKKIKLSKKGKKKRNKKEGKKYSGVNDQK